MTYHRRVHLTILPVLVAAASALLLLGLLGRPAPTRAAPAATIRYVATSGDDTANVCTNSANPCRTIQQAVNVAGWQANDEIRVATGVYTSGSGMVLFIQNTVRVRGGFTTTNWTTPHPDSLPTVLDGEGKDRVVYINASTDITPTLEGLWLTNGVASGDGGGIYAIGTPHPVISGCRIFNNTSNGDGGGLYMEHADAAMLFGNKVYSNTAASGVSGGGGIYIFQSSDVTLASNTIQGNTAMYLGGGIALPQDDVTLLNNAVVENRLLIPNGFGAGINLGASRARMLHTTIARNSGGDGQGLNAWGSATRVWLTNTILVSHTIGIETVSGACVTLTHTLWGAGEWANVTDTVGSNIVIGTHNWWEEPGFLYPGGGDYHIGGESGPLNRALDTGLTTDIDGDSRPFCGDSDLGADEASCCANLNGTLYPLVQAAVGASSSPDDVVKVAGTCSGVSFLRAENQVVYVSRTITIRGGYTVQDWSTSDPVANPTTLDAAGRGRAVFVSPPPPYTPISVTVKGLRLTRGAGVFGGGIYASYSTLDLDNCWVYDNMAESEGGGVYLRFNEHSRLAGNRIYGNSAGNGGGFLIDQSETTSIASNQIYSNVVWNTGGGIAVRNSASTTLVANRIYANTAEEDAAGVGLSLSDNVQVTDNLVYGNTGFDDGTGFSIGGCNDATFVNNVVAGNHTTGAGDGAGMRIGGSRIRLLHTTIARNTGGDGSGLHIYNGSTVALTNTVLVGQGVGITVTDGSTGTLHATLWGDGTWANTIDAAGNVFTSIDIFGDPAFVDPDSDDYHIGAGSGAFNAGVDAGVASDFDGEPRVGAPDLGADEFVLSAYLPLVLRNY